MYAYTQPKHKSGEPFKTEPIELPGVYAGRYHPHTTPPYLPPDKRSPGGYYRGKWERNEQGVWFYKVHKYQAHRMPPRYANRYQGYRKYGKRRTKYGRKKPYKKPAYMDGEKKWFLFSTTGQTVSTTGVTHELSNIARGLDSNDRIGRRATAVEINAKGKLALDGTNRSDLIRFALVQARTPTAPTTALLWDPQTILGLRELNRVKDYRVIREWRYHLRSDIDSEDIGEQFFQWNVKFRSDMLWDENTDTAAWGQIFLCHLGEATAGTNDTLLDLNVRLRFYG